MAKKADELSPDIRAEDIILGALGYGEEATIVSIEQTETGFRGVGSWKDGEQFDFENEDELTELDRWALELLTAKRRRK